MLSLVRYRSFNDCRPLISTAPPCSSHCAFNLVRRCFFSLHFYFAAIYFPCIWGSIAAFADIFYVLVVDFCALTLAQLYSIEWQSGRGYTSKHTHRLNWNSTCIFFFDTHTNSKKRIIVHRYSKSERVRATERNNRQRLHIKHCFFEIFDSI